MEDMEEICKTDLKNLLSPFSYSDVYQRSTADPGRRRINSGIHYRARIASSELCNNLINNVLLMMMRLNIQICHFINQRRLRLGLGV